MAAGRLLRNKLLMAMASRFVLALALLAGPAAPAGAASSDEDLLLLTVASRTALPSGSATIGPAGGTVRAGSGAATFPANSLGAATTVTLATARTAPVFLGRPASLVYTLDLAGGGMDKPVTMTVSGFGGADRDVPVALADQALYGGQSNQGRPTVVTGQVRSGTLTFAIPATDAQAESGAVRRTAGVRAADTPTQTGYTFWALAGFSAMQSAHFRLYYPASILTTDPGMAQTILNDAEDAYTLLCDMGFVMTGLTFPVTITVEGGMGTRDGEAGLPLSGKGGQYLNLSDALCVPASLQKLRATIGHEFFHIVQNLYDPRSALRIRHPRLRPYFLWLSEASSVWFESVILGSTTYVADIFVTNIDTYRQGPETFTDHAEAQSIGYVNSGFLRYLTDARGSNTLVYDIWKEVREEGKGTADYSDLTALIRGVGSAVDTAAKWTDHMQRLLAKTSGHAGWPEPSPSTTYYSYGSQGYISTFDVASTVAPFAARKWKVIFKKLRTGENDYFVRADSTDTLEYALYKGSGTSPVYARLGAFAANAPLNFTVAEGDSVIVTASNSDTTPPYLAERNAAVHIGPKGACRFCSGIPTTASLTIVNEQELLWRHAASGYEVAREFYWDNARTSIRRADCSDYATGCRQGIFEWYENGNRQSEQPMDCEENWHGIRKHYYETGIPKEFVGYVHGYRTGPYEKYYPNGNYQTTGYMTNGAYTGTWTWYDEDGTPNQVCTGMGTESVNCYTPG